MVISFVAQSIKQFLIDDYILHITQVFITRSNQLTRLNRHIKLSMRPLSSHKRIQNFSGHSPWDIYLEWHRKFAWSQILQRRKPRVLVLKTKIKELLAQINSPFSNITSNYQWDLFIHTKEFKISHNTTHNSSLAATFLGYTNFEYLS